ncbi:Putative membrane protein, partial [Gloeomargarita lithophora Alchichica-D10]
APGAETGIGLGGGTDCGHGGVYSDGGGGVGQGN